MRGVARGETSRLKAFYKQVLRDARGLQCRSTVLLMAVVTIATTLMGMMYMRVSARLATERNERFSRLLARSIATSSADALGYQDREELLKVAQHLMSDDKIAYIAFADLSGTIIAGSQQGAGQFGKFLSGEGARIQVHPLDRPTLVADSNLGPRIDIVYPVEDTSPEAMHLVPRPVVGFVRLGLNMADVDRALMATGRQVTGISIGVVLLMVPLGFEIVRRIVSPLNQISTAALELAGGRLGTRVSVVRGDEIGRLAEAFNRMGDDLQRSHDALVKLNSELELRVARRTEQLSESNRLLHIEIAEREELLRAVSHDMHAPLRNISGQTMLLRRKTTGLPETVSHGLERIEHNAKYAIDMIDELLELSRVRTVREPSQELDLEKEIREIVRQLEFELEGKGIVFEIEGQLPTMVAYRRRIRQLFQNLIDNSIKYTPSAAERGERQASIRVSSRAREGEFEFRIADRGIGVRPEDRRTIFNVFSRARTQFVSRTPGKGVGLSHCKGIVQLYGGQIWVEENPGGGTVFCFTLARPEALKPSEAKPAEATTELETVGAAHG